MKKLHIDAVLSRVDKDGEVSSNDIALGKELLEMELREEKAESHKRMAWLSMIAMVAFPLLLLALPENKAETLVGISSMYYVSLASIVGMFFGASAYMSKH